jgi:hypothetical protein
MATYNEAEGLQHYPTPMARFGTNLWGDNLYRIVLARTRKSFTAGIGWSQKYNCQPHEWVLEKWISVEQFAGCDRETWARDKGMLLGGYPDRGEYELCHIFETCNPDNANIEKLIAWIEMGQRNTPAEIAASIKKEQERALAAKRSSMRDRIANLLPAFGTAPMVGHGGTRGSKAGQLQRSAAQVAGAVARKRLERPTYQIPVEV